jgi:hypothetical protein
MTSAWSLAKQQETVMDNQIVETRALSDDELNAVAGGDNKQKEQENSEQLKALETFAKVLAKAGQI